jgi:hypothetical protein
MNKSKEWNKICGKCNQHQSDKQCANKMCVNCCRDTYEQCQHHTMDTMYDKALYYERTYDDQVNCLIMDTMYLPQVNMWRIEKMNVRHVIV